MRKVRFYEEEANQELRDMMDIRGYIIGLPLALIIYGIYLFMYALVDIG